MQLFFKTRQTTLVLALAVAALSITAVGAQRSSADPSGTWRLTVSNTNSTAPAAAQTLKLKFNDRKLTGTLTHFSSAVVKGKARVAELPITEAKFEGGAISFDFTHPPAAGNGPNANYHYEGTLSSDRLKGTVTSEWMGHSRTKTWEATRLKQ